MFQSNTQQDKGEANMIRLLLLFLTMFILSSCGGGGGSSTSTPSGSVGTYSQKAIYVNQKTGSDENSGSATSPVKTLTKAIKKAKEKKFFSIYVHPGVYGSESGEVFPLVLPENIDIRKHKTINDEESGGDVVIYGSGVSQVEAHPVSIIMIGGSELNTITINSKNGIGVVSESGANELVGVKVMGGIVGVSVRNKSVLNVFSSKITNNYHAGIEAGGDSVITLIQSAISMNNIGVILTESGLLTTGNGGKAGSSFVGTNDSCDFYSESTKDVDLSSFIWDDNQFDFNIESDCDDGSNLVNIGSGGVDYQIIPDESGALFASHKIIKTFSPDFGGTVYTTNPNVSFTGYNNKLVMAAIWKDMPMVVDNRIENIKDIVWFWHSGMQNSPIGYVTYESGKYPKDGNLNPKDVSTLEPAPPLEKGRAYYWAVWEWDDSGVKIDASSSISYFKVARF